MTEPDHYTEEQIKEELRQKYRQETGKELPEHIVENYETFFQIGPSTEDIQRLLENEKLRRQKLRDKLYSPAEVAGALGVIGVIIGLTGFVAGAVFVGLSYEMASLSVPFVAFVFTAFGFVVGALLS